MNGQILINKAIIEAMKPKVKINGDTWAEETIKDVPYSPYPGRLSLDFTPWMREPLRAATSEGDVSLVVLLMAVQGGKTLIYDLATAYHSAHNASTILVISDTDDNAKDYAKTRLNLLFEGNDVLKRLLPQSSRRNTNLMHMLTNGTTWWTTGANNIKNLQRRSIRVVIGDEVWLWPEGHIAEAQARTTRFIGSSKVIIGSQAGLMGHEFERYWLQTDRREWCFACPECGEVQPWTLDTLDWNHEAHTPEGAPDYSAIRDTAHYRCRKCGATWNDSEKSRALLNAASHWESTAPGRLGARGYHMTALPYMPAGELACEYVAARVKVKEGDPTALQIFTQKRLAEFWDPLMGASEEDEITERTGILFGDKAWPRMSWIRIEKKKRTFVDKIVPGKGVSFSPLAFMTVDVQKDHFWFVVRAWNKDGSSMLIECGILQFWDDIPKKAQEYGLPPAHVGIDAGDQHGTVYAFCEKWHYYALKGMGIRQFKHTRNGICYMHPYSETRAAFASAGRACKFFAFSADYFKDYVYFARLRTRKGGAPTWECPQNTPDFYKNHLKAESRTEMENGEFHWKNTSNKPNHSLDCETMNAALAMRKGIPINGTQPATR